jgi:hypothetical protein
MNSPVRSALARDVILLLQRNLHRLDFPDVPSAALENMQTMHTLAVQTATLLNPVSTAKRLEGRELWASLAHAIVAIARAKRAVRLTPKDLKDLVEDHCQEHDMAFWLEQSAPTVVGLLRHEPEVRKLIEPHAVLCWDMWEDEQWRIVDTRWLEAHADIRLFVTDPWPGGRYCRFCYCQENPHVNALLQVDVERRNGVLMVGDVVVLQVGGALTHEQCRPYWIRWCEIAAKYPSTQEAAAADKAAGRVSRYEKAMQTLTLEAPAP